MPKNNKKSKSQKKNVDLSEGKESSKAPCTIDEHGSKIEVENDPSAIESRADSISVNKESVGPVMKELSKEHSVPDQEKDFLSPSNTAPMRHIPATLENRPVCKSIGNYLKPFQDIQEMKTMGKGSEGRKIRVLTNHFPIQCKTEDVTHYDAKFNIVEYKRPPKKSDADLLFRALEEVKRSNPKVFTKPKSVVFDGFANIFSLYPLNFSNNSSKFDATVMVKEALDMERLLNVEVALTRIATIPIKKAIEEFQRSGRLNTIDKDRHKRTTDHSEYLEAVRVLNVILGMSVRIAPNNICINNAKHFTPGPGCSVDIGGGKSLWLGTFKSVRTGWKLHLNVDMANKPGYEEQSVLEFASKLANCRPQDIRRVITDKTLWTRLSKELCGLKIRFERPDGQKRDYRANGLTKDIGKYLTFPSAEGKTSVINYFKKQYNFDPNPELPFLHVGAKDKSNFLPLECCKIKAQACPRNKRLDERATSYMIRQTAKPPSERKERIQKNLRDMKNSFKDDEFASAFGITVDDKFIDIEARVLSAPALSYQDAGSKLKEKSDLFVSGGKWNMRTPSKPGTKGDNFINAMQLMNWGVLDLTAMNDTEWSNFYGQLRRESEKCGMKMIQEPVAEIMSKERVRSFSNVEECFRSLYRKILVKCRDNNYPQLILVLAERRDGMYDHIKYIGDTGDGLKRPIPTQFVLIQNARRMNGQIAHNLSLKMNAKLGGTNQVISMQSKPNIMKRPVIFIGADVTHGNPGDNIEEHPSIAAVVASMDASCSTYKARVSLQYGGQVFEVIQQLETMVKELLMEFYGRNHQRKPEKIIYYRDGVSEGQFNEVVCKELSAIQRACMKLEKDYQPNITFVVAQKRHNTRLFPKNPNDGVGKMKNVPPGTVVDSDITHPTEMSFFLVSHEGIQGTSRPTHYHLLSDDSDFTPDELQKITYYLCHLYARCERSVSYPAPTYYAHLAAFRARGHHNALVENCKNNKLNCTQRKKIERQIEQLQLCNYFI